MAKNNKSTSLSFSPETYIKTKARGLEIGKCWMNNDWQSIGLVDIVVTRVHPQGTLTVGIYLVDTYCRGIFNSFYRFSVYSDQLNELLMTFKNAYGDAWQETDYATVHNLILGAEQYAEELGIKPCKEWAVTQYLLEEDTDDIPLMEFEYGKNGRPFLCVRTGLEASRYIPQLDKSVGKGNYDVLIGLDDDKFDDDYEDDFDDNEEYDDEEYEDDFEDGMGPAIYTFNSYNPADLSPYQEDIFHALIIHSASEMEGLSDAFKQLAEISENDVEVYTREYLRSLVRNAMASLDDIIASSRDSNLNDSDHEHASMALPFLVIYKETYKEVQKTSVKEIKKMFKNHDMGKLLDRIDKAVNTQFEEVDRMMELMKKMHKGE